MNRLLFWALVVPAAAVLVLLLAVFMLVVLVVAPPASSVAALVILALGAGWFFLVRGKSAGAATEGSLMGRQSSTEGLL